MPVGECGMREEAGREDSFQAHDHCELEFNPQRNSGKLMSTTNLRVTLPKRVRGVEYLYTNPHHLLSEACSCSLLTERCKC